MMKVWILNRCCHFFVAVLLVGFVGDLAWSVQTSPDSQERSIDQQEEESEQEKLPTIGKVTEGLDRSGGFFDFYWDPVKGRILLEVANDTPEFLYVHSLATGLGSNPVGLDRGQLGSEKVVRFHRVGPKVLLIERNLRFRAQTENPLERRAVEQSFAESAIWGGKVVAESESAYLVDVTPMMMADMHGVTRTLDRTDQGEFSLDKDASAVFLPRCKSFPDNTELESTLTFTGKKPGPHVVQTAPTPTAITLRQHHSLIRLPSEPYQPRKFDVRCPSIHITFADYASPLESPLEHRWIIRHRLEKRDPSAAVSEPVEPIVYYVDAGAPQQIQQALIEGASWWNDAFEAAGFRNAFQVQLLPPDADPLDVRYNVIQWVHRSTRGWSYGGSVIDPRTGEILKGHVTLGSLRVRQDQLLVEGLHPGGPANGSRCACCGIAGMVEDTTLADQDPETSALEVALARIRQLSAHEVGHTLGFVHNFAASTYDDRASVMDYPAPKILINENGRLDLSDAYGVGIGSWDKIAVQYAYSQFAPGVNEQESLERILADAAVEGMIFISDADARPAGAIHPLANLWDNGTDPLAELQHVLRVRRIALNRFDPDSLPAGTPAADIAQYLTPVYLHHRFQLKAAAKLVGGYEYDYRYSGTPGMLKPVNATRQQQAIDVILETVHPSALTLDPAVVRSITPRPFSSFRDREVFDSKSGRVFDPLAAASVAAKLSLDELLQYQRLERLTIQSRDEGFLSPSQLMDRVTESIWQPDLPRDPRTEFRQISRVVREQLTDSLIGLADHSQASLEVRSAALMALQRLARISVNAADPQEQAFRSQQVRRIRLFLDRPYPDYSPPQSLPIPPGDPIGSPFSPGRTGR